jgi:hypothetical protein
MVIRLGNAEIISSRYMNISGVIFYSKLNWSEQVTTALIKTHKSLIAIKLIRRFFSTTDTFLS